MKWLKAILGEETYNGLGTETINLLKEHLGEQDYIPNDPTKIIPKSVFNEKNQEAKLLQSTIDTMKEQLKNVGSMVTEKDMLEKLAIKENDLQKEIKAMQNKHKTELDQTKKEQLVTSYLADQKCKSTELMLKNIDYEKLVMSDDGKLLNADNVVLPLKENYPFCFEDDKKTGVTPLKGANPTPDIKVNATKEQLLKQYDDACKTGDYRAIVSTERLLNDFKE